MVRLQQLIMINKKILFEHLLESMQEGVIFIDENDNLAYFNNSTLKLLPTNLDKYIGTNIVNCHIPENIETVQKIIEQFKEGKHEHYHHIRHIGGKFYEDRIYPVLSQKGEYLGLLLLLQDITKRKKLEDEIRSLAIKDGLTGLYNLRHFYEELERELARSQRQKGYKISLIFFDIDKFKQYNDLFGHLTGDEALKNVADIAAKVTRKNVDSVFRYGGDEFAVILPDTPEKSAVIVAERLRKAYAEINPNNTSLSIGVIAYSPEMDIDQFINSADRAMYAAKFAGGNRVQLFHPDIILPEQNLFTNSC